MVWIPNRRDEVVSDPTGGSLEVCYTSKNKPITYNNYVVKERSKFKINYM